MNEKKIITLIENNKCLPIISTNNGYIENGDKIIADYCDNIELTAAPVSRTIDCTVSVIKNDDLIDYQTFPLHLDDLSFGCSNISAFSVDSTGKTMTDKMKHFLSSLDMLRFPYHLTLKIDDEINVLVNGNLSEDIWVSFGENTVEINDCDFIFKLYKHIKQFNIPDEIIHERYARYNHLGSLCISNLIKPAFLACENIFFKVPISNKLEIMKIVRK